MKHCASCQIDYADHDKFCARCGNPLQPRQEGGEKGSRCSHCGAAISLTDTFCSGCGKSTAETEERTPKDDARLGKTVIEDPEAFAPEAIPPPVRNTLRCPACGDPVAREEMSCGSCGAALREDHSETGYPSAQDLPSASRSPRLKRSDFHTDETEAEFEIEQELRQKRRAIFQSIGAGLGVGALIVSLILGGFYLSRQSSSPPHTTAPIIDTPQPALPEPAIVPPVPAPGAPEEGFVMTVEEMGIQINGAGARDPNRASGVIRGSVESFFPPLKETYRRYLQSTPSLQGLVILNMKVSPTGAVSDVKYTTRGLADPSIGQAAKAFVMTWKFPPAAKGVVFIRYPLLFYPKGVDPKSLLASVRPTGEVKTAEQVGLRIVGAGIQHLERSELAVQQQVETFFPQLKEEYEKVLQEDATFKIGLTLQLAISPEGGVVFVEAVPVKTGSTIRSFIKTVETQAQSWRFPSVASESVTVHYPLVFYPRDTDPKDLLASLRLRESERRDSIEKELLEPADPEEKGPREEGNTVPPETRPAPPQKQPFVAGRYRVVRPTFVHERPTWTSRELKHLNIGKRLTIVGKQGDWLEVQPTSSENPPGFVWQEHVSKSDD